MNLVDCMEFDLDEPSHELISMNGSPFDIDNGRKIAYKDIIGRMKLHRRG